MSSNVLNISLDLGSDTLKIAFAYKSEVGVEFGKFASAGKPEQLALPAVAYYDTESGKWLYADQVDRFGGENFTTVVKIKSLVSMLTMCNERAVWERNKNYYYCGHEFPKFYFPVRRKALDNFDKMVRDGRTFTVEAATPQSVCGAFFEYAHQLVEYRIRELSEATGIEFSDYRIALVHPARVGEEYLKELEKLIANAFGRSPCKVLNINKVLAQYALYRNDVSEGEQFLVFDMGEEDISVVRAEIRGGQAIIDGVEGHNLPADIGGIDVDESIVRYLEYVLEGRETVGTPPSGEEGHIAESSVYEKQYLLMKDVKKAKVIFSRASAAQIFEHGVPITFHRDVLIQRRLTAAESALSIGVTKKAGIAKKILDYIVEELNRPLNRDVQKIFVSGGLASTYALIDFIRSELRMMGCPAMLYTFTDKRADSAFDIQPHEGSVFAAAVGGAIVALLNIEIKTVLSLSYGTWSTYEDPYSNERRKTLSLFVDRGVPLRQEGNVFANTFNLEGKGIEGEEMYSTIVTRADIHNVFTRYGRASAWNFSADGRVIIGNQGDPIRAQAEADIDLRTVSGGRNSRIIFVYNGSEITLAPGVVLVAREGIRVDKNGHVEPFIENVSSNRIVGIVYPNGARVQVPLNFIQTILVGVGGWETANQ